jgi:hypothetical protein
MSSRRGAVPLLIALLTMAAVPSSAAAGVNNFSMTPTSGPPGTTVSVSGTGCAPGLLFSASQDFVAVSATTVPAVSKHIAVAPDGAWRDTIVIPANAAAASAVVTAVCFSGDLQSLLTIYVPQTFTVTPQPASTTTVANLPPTTSSSPTTSPTGAVATTTSVATGTTVGTTPGSATGNTTSTTLSPSAGPPKNHHPKGRSGDSTGGGGATGADPTAPGTGIDNANPTAGSSTKDALHAISREGAHDQSSVRAADLGDPTLASTIGGGDASGLGWLEWLLLIVVCATLGTFGVWMLWWRRRDIEGRSTPPPA